MTYTNFKPSTAKNYDDIVNQYSARTRMSRKLQEKAASAIPGGVNRSIVHFEPNSIFVKYGEGAHIVDEDGNKYLDCIANYTSMAIGHAHSDVVRSVVEQAQRGSAWAGASAVEGILAKKIVNRLPSVDCVKFTSSGTEATLMAVRAARAHTGRSLIAKFEGGYHGLHDYAMISMAPALERAGPADDPFAVAPAGIPDAVRDSVVVLPFNNLEACRSIVRRHAKEIAGILVEPVPGVAGVLVPSTGFLEGLRELADEVGCLLIFDEVITFRLDYSGAPGRFGVRSDLTTLGKIIGGGYPIGAIGGRADVMQVFAPTGSGCKVTLSGTFHANPVILAAGIATLDVFSRQAVNALNGMSHDFVISVKRLLKDYNRPIQINAIGSLFNFHATTGDVSNYRDAQRSDKNFLKHFYLALLNEGVMLSPRGMGVLSTAMRVDDVDFLLESIARALERLAVR